MAQDEIYANLCYTPIYFTIHLRLTISVFVVFLLLNF